MAQDSVTEYKIGPAIVRMHGQPDREKVKAATAKFLNQVEHIRRQNARKDVKHGNHHGNSACAGHRHSGSAV